MTKIKIKSNPYTREISYLTMDDATGDWVDVKSTDERSRLRETDSERSFLPFKIKEIIKIIIDEYYVGRGKIQLFFEGTQDEYAEVESVCLSDDVKDKIELFRTSVILENARFIKGDIKEIFEKVNPIIETIMKEDEPVKRGLNKVSQALDDVIPICVFGNYSAGKSTFINALIGAEILPSGGDPVTAKIYEIKRSENDDKALISFDYHKEKVQISFEGKELRFLHGNTDSELLSTIKEEIEKEETDDLYTMVRIALNLINGFEKKDRSVTEIGNVISLEVPFSLNGVLGQSTNNFVIFDTPGSNSNSNADHSKVLAEAMDGFSNGIPVWVTQYEAIDSEDNASLCDKVLAIEALDKRFTMIVLNKADGSDLEEGGFSDDQIKEILEYKAVEKMFASGIFFVSSIMGLGGKNNGNLIDKFYRKTFRSQQEMYSDPDDIDYMMLYRYNIMPEQIKSSAIEYSEACENMIYANSGLYCIEKEIESFGSKHSAYNKCQMVFAFLNNVIDKTNERIDSKEKTIKKIMDESQQKLDDKKRKLQEDIETLSTRLETDFNSSSKEHVHNYVEQEMNYNIDEVALEQRDKERRDENFTQNDFENREKKEYEESKDKFWEHLKESGQGLFKRNILESVKDIATDISQDLKDIQDSKQRKDERVRELDKEVSDEIIRYVIDQYRDNFSKAQDELEDYLDDFWKEKERDFKKSLIREVTKSDALSESQREEIADMIEKYASVEFKDKAESIFVKKKFLKGALLGIRFTNNEKLDINRLAVTHNDAIRKDIRAMSTELNNKCSERFKTWKDSFVTEIKSRLIKLNPELKDIDEIIQHEQENLDDLRNYRITIHSSIEAIKELMAWKEL